MNKEGNVMFAGFSPETVDFLWGIRMNNNREWFAQHKQQYVTYLYEPMKALGAELFTPFAQGSGNILKVSRIYRDARRHHPAPYKEGLWLCIRREAEEWMDHPFLYFEINPEGAEYGFCYWSPKAAVMERFRRELAANPRPFLELISATEAAVGMPIQANPYKKPKKAEDPSLDRFFSWHNQICCTRAIAPGPELFGPELKDEVADFLEKLTPIYEFFNRFQD